MIAKKFRERRSSGEIAASETRCKSCCNLLKFLRDYWRKSKNILNPRPLRIVSHFSPEQMGTPRYIGDWSITGWQCPRIAPPPPAAAILKGKGSQSGCANESRKISRNRGEKTACNGIAVPVIFPETCLPTVEDFPLSQKTTENHPASSRKNLTSLRGQIPVEKGKNDGAHYKMARLEDRLTHELFLIHSFKRGLRKRNKKYKKFSHSSKLKRIITLKIGRGGNKGERGEGEREMRGKAHACRRNNSIKKEARTNGG